MVLPILRRRLECEVDPHSLTSGEALLDHHMAMKVHSHPILRLLLGALVAFEALLVALGHLQELLASLKDAAQPACPRFL